MSMINAFSAEDAKGLSSEQRDLIARRDRLLGPAYRLFYENPVHVVRGEGAHLYGPNGEVYLDAYNNVASVGHCHPHVVAAMHRQASQLNAHTRYINETVLDYAEKLLGHFPPQLAHVMFTCTGSEANDLAFRVATNFTGGTGFIVTELAYHGVTQTIASMSPSLGAFAEIGDCVRLVPAPDSYRGSNQDIGAAFAAGVRSAIEDFTANGIKPAALLIDTIFSSDGVFADPPGFLSEAVATIRAAGGLFIADEVQPGFGRTGSHMWGFQRHGIAPDIVTIGKPMGNGYPIAGMVARADVLQTFGERVRYFNTFGGNPVAAAAGHAVLEVIESEKLMQNARAVGSYMIGQLQGMMADHTLIGDVRGAGFFIGVEIVDDRRDRAPDAARATRIVNGLRERGILISASGPGANVLKIRPPLCFSRDNADRLLGELDSLCRQLS